MILNAETFNKYFQNLVPNLYLKVPNNLEMVDKHQKMVMKF